MQILKDTKHAKKYDSMHSYNDNYYITNNKKILNIDTITNFYKNSPKIKHKKFKNENNIIITKNKIFDIDKKRVKKLSKQKKYTEYENYIISKSNDDNILIIYDEYIINFSDGIYKNIYFIDYFENIINERIYCIECLDNNFIIESKTKLFLTEYDFNTCKFKIEQICKNFTSMDLDNFYMPFNDGFIISIANNKIFFYHYYENKTLTMTIKNIENYMCVPMNNHFIIQNKISDVAKIYTIENFKIKKICSIHTEIPSEGYTFEKDNILYIFKDKEYIKAYMFYMPTLDQYNTFALNIRNRLVNIFTFLTLYDLPKDIILHIFNYIFCK